MSLMNLIIDNDKVMELISVIFHLHKVTGCLWTLPEKTSYKGNLQSQFFTGATAAWPGVREM